MSLDYNCHDIEDWEKLHDSEKEWEKTQTLIFATLAVDLGEVTTKNFVEFYSRWFMFNRIIGENPVLTVHDVKRRIGLRTNVVNLTHAKWLQKMKKIVDHKFTDVVRDCRWKLSKEK